MKILYIVKSEMSETGKRLVEVQRSANDVTVVNLNEKTAEELLDLIESNDKVIMW
jgi:DNA uptake protein ComE-like DNA-binding protein